MFFAYMKITKEAAHIGIVGFAFKAQCTSVVQKNAELIWQSCHQAGNWIDLHLLDLVALVIGRSFGIIPRKRAMKEVNENVGKGFQIIMAWLFDTQVAIEQCKWGSTCEDIMVQLNWHMNLSPRVSVPLGKTKIDDEGLIAIWTCSDQKVGRLDVTVNEVGRVDMLYMWDLWNCIVSRTGSYKSQ